jgi:high-affinity Fe2+/Pb2+ permease
MIDKQARARQDIRKSILPLGIGAAAAVVLAVYDAFLLVSQEGNPSQIAGVLCTLAAGVLVLLATWALRRQSKYALGFFIAALGFGTIRWVFVDRSFALTLPTVALLAVFAWFLARLASWVRIGALR